MAANDYLRRCDSVDDDYIDMEVSAFSSGSFFCNSNNNNGEFEFQMSNRFLDRDSTILTSPADELFYKGTILPLHLPPRLQMVKKLLETTKDYCTFDDFYISTGPLAATTTTMTPTPFQSCNVSPAESCEASKELNKEEYFLDDSENSWTRKLRLMIKQSSVGSKLKASKQYLRWVFGKSSCSHESCISTAKVVDEVKFSKIEFTKNPFGQIQHKRHRRSSSVYTTRCQSTKNSTRMPSSNTAEATRFHQCQLLKRSSTTSSSEIENPIQGAILHCKQSLQQLHLQHPEEAENEIGFYSLTASRISVADNQERV